jgi:hypothetical protein
MTKIFLIALSFLSFFQGMSVGVAGERGPCFSLSNGARICEPMVVSAAQELTVYAEVDANAVAERVKPFGLKPVRVGGEQSARSLAVVDFSDFQATNIGPYQEFGLYYVVQPESGNLRFDCVTSFVLSHQTTPAADSTALPSLAYFAETLVLDGKDSSAIETAILAGVEVYGYPKERGSIQASLDGHFSKSLSVTDPRDGLNLDLDLASLTLNSLGIPAQKDMVIATTGLGHLAWTVGELSVLVSEPMPIVGKFDLYATQEPLQSWLKRLELSPRILVYMPKKTMLFHSLYSP